MASSVSPASSPRLPSPPPIAEDQIGPTSPGVSLFEEHGKFPGINSIDSGASRRIRPGTKAEDMAEGPPLTELQELDSAFQLTEHLKALHHSHTHPPNSDSIQPITADIAKQLTTPPPTVSQDIWLYELGRFLIQKTNAIIVALFADTPPCSAQTCPEMRASEWQYLCAVHDPPKSCHAIDYCCHTLDWAATTLTSSKMFPSRLGLGSGSGGAIGNDKVLQQQMKEIKNIFRRVYRIYAHAWFQHREMFWRVEGKTGLYIFFKTVCDEYGIIEPENYTIPSEAEGLEPVADLEQTKPIEQTPTLLRREPEAGLGVSGTGDGTPSQPEPAGNNVISMGDTTKRHRHTMSDLSSSAANVIQEEAEEDENEEPAEEKPSLPRQPTALKDASEEPAEAPEESEASDDDPKPGILRSDTIKPSKEKEAEKPEDDDDDEITLPIDTSAIAEPDVKVEEEVETQDAQQHPQEQPAVESEDITKTVED